MKTRHWLLRAVLVAATVVLAVLFASHGAAAEDELEGIDDFYDAIPDEVAELLPEDFFTSEPTRLAAAVHEAAGGKNLLDAALAAIGGGIGTSVRLFATLCGVALAAAVLGSVRELAAPRGLGGAITLIINAAAAVAAVGTQYVSFEAISAYFERLIMSALLPLMGVLYAMGGNSGGAALNNSTVLLWLELIGLFTTAVLMPAVSVMTALAVAGAFLPGVRTSGLSKFIGKSVGTILGLAAVLLGTALGAQSVLTASGDRLGFRTAKFVAGSMIPVVGSTVGDSLRTLAASVSMLRSTVGTAGIVVLVLLLLPTLVSLMLSRLAFLASAGVADMLGVGTAGQLYREMSSVYGLLTAAAALSALIFVFALTVFALTSAAVA